ncbi:MAG: DUF6783 domain-containing protein [[Clostridium] symbiosum]|nr:DUF6783 domain-containing protein [[Clostridium] symbiosum]
MKIAFCQLCITLCGRFGPNERGVVGWNSLCCLDCDSMKEV